MELGGADSVSTYNDKTTLEHRHNEVKTRLPETVPTWGIKKREMGRLTYFGSKVFQDGCQVNGRSRAHPGGILALLQVAGQPADRELKARPGRLRHRLLPWHRASPHRHWPPAFLLPIWRLWFLLRLTTLFLHHDSFDLSKTDAKLIECQGGCARGTQLQTVIYLSNDFSMGWCYSGILFIRLTSIQLVSSHCEHTCWNSMTLISP